MNERCVICHHPESYIVLEAKNPKTNKNDKFHFCQHYTAKALFDFVRKPKEPNPLPTPLDDSSPARPSQIRMIALIFLVHAARPYYWLMKRVVSQG